MPAITLSGKITDVFVRKPGFSVLKFQTRARKPFFAVGDIGEFDEGDSLELMGAWHDHPKYGTQFKFEAAVRPIPSTSEAIEKFLVEYVKGCGPKMARKLLQATGDRFDAVLERQPDTLLSIKGVKPELLTRIREAWNANGLEKQVSLFLAKYQIGLGWTQRVAKHFGTRAVAALTENPYRFTEIDGIGFKRADEIALRMGWSRCSPQRAEAILLYLMAESETDGHVFLTQAELQDKMFSSGVTMPVAQEALETHLQHRKVQRVRARGASGAEASYIYLPHMLAYEEGLARAIHSRAVLQPTLLGNVLQAMIHEAEIELGVELTAEQRQAVGNAFERGISVVTGSPGTGKSTLVKVLTQVAWRMNQEVVLAAPTGRAAKNLANITGHDSSTIHALLKFNPGESPAWQRNAQEPIEADLVVVDESSMVELEVAYRLLDAAPLSANILLIGDDNQLPSVGPGRILNDVIESGHVPVVRLTKIHRQAAKSQIVRNAYRVLEGKPPVFAPRDEEGNLTDCHLLQPPANLETTDAKVRWIHQTLVDLMRRRLPNHYGINPMRDIQVLSPMRKGPLGVYELNVLLQEALNPKRPETREIYLFGRLFRTGDRILCNKNNAGPGLVNGDVGTLARIDPPAQLLTLDVGGEEFSLDFENADKLSLAYVITIHKSQGGEYPIVIGLFFHQHFVMLQRALLYTGMTRPRKQMIFLATEAALKMAAENAETVRRNTLLAQRIRMLAARKAA